LKALKAVEPHQALAFFDSLFRQDTEARTLTNKQTLSLIMNGKI